MKTIEAMLAEHPLFEDLEPRHLHLLASGATEDRWQAQQYLFSEGEKAGKWYVIRKGKVALETGAPPQGPRTLETIEEGEVLGWSWLLPPYRWPFSARVLEPTQVIVLDGVYLREQCEADHDFGYELLKRVAQGIVQRLEALRLQLLYGRPQGSV